jgi:hypothetical protein
VPQEGDTERRQQLRQHGVTAFFVLLALSFSAVLAYLAFQPPGEKPSFVRVGGQSRTETATEASEFWESIPDGIVVIPRNATGKAMLEAASIAATRDDPLLFTPLTREVPSALRKTLTKRDKACVDLLGRNAELKRMPETLHKREKSCKHHASPRSSGEAPRVRLIAFSRPSLLESALGPTLVHKRHIEVIAQPTKECKLAKTLVFATVQHAPDVPDAAVAIVLASHLARNHGNKDVGVVVLPRYLQLSPELQNFLRNCGSTVHEAFIVGGPAAVSDDLRDLLKVIVIPSDIEKRLAALKDLLSLAGQLLVPIIVILGIIMAKKRYDTLKEQRPGLSIFSALVQLPKFIIQRRNPRRPAGLQQVTTSSEADSLPDPLQSTLRQAIPEGTGAYLRLCLKSPPTWIAGAWASLDDQRKSFANDSFIYLVRTVECDPSTGEFRFDTNGSVILRERALLIPLKDVALVEVIDA